MTSQSGQDQYCFGGYFGDWAGHISQKWIPGRTDEVDGPRYGTVKIYDLMADIGEVTCQNTGPKKCTRSPN